MKEFNLTVRDQKFEDTCELNFEVRLRDAEKVIERIKLLQAKGIEVNFNL